MEQQSLYTTHSLQGIILIKDSLQADGAFLAPHSMHAALQEGTQVTLHSYATSMHATLMWLEQRITLQVVLVTLANTVAHYQHVLRKLVRSLQPDMQRKAGLLASCNSEYQAALSCAGHKSASMYREQEGEHCGGASRCGSPAGRQAVPPQNKYPYAVA